MEEVLAQLYYAPNNPAGFATEAKLYEAAKQRDPTISRSQVRDWLRSQFTYTLHKPARRRFKRRRVLASRPGQHVQIDLVDLQRYRADNDGHNFLLVAIDVFSKFAYVLPLRDKKGVTLKAAFEDIFGYRQPENIFSDAGTEFLNRPVQEHFERHGINHMVAQNPETKASVVERFNRTLKEKLFKYLTARGHGRYRYLDALPQVLQAYNETVHSSTKYRPVDVNDDNAAEVFRNLYGAGTLEELHKQKQRHPKLKVGQRVRLSYHLGVFDKRYHPNWSDHVYTITKVLHGSPVLYRIADGHGTVLSRRFYEPQLQPVEEGLYRVDRILRRRNGRALVSWIGYDPSFNSWEPEDNIINL
jgi:transposase InsO family protein